jgi:ribosomal protein S27E
MSNKKLIKKLKDAYVTCFDCGKKYGVYSVGCSSVWQGKCDVCGETKGITETRDFAYFVTGIRKLIEEDNETKVS